MDLDPSTWKKEQLQVFLRSKGQPCGGNKPDLLAAVKDYLQRPQVKCVKTTPTTDLSIFQMPNIVWIDVDKAKPTFPAPFDLSEVTRFLTSQTIFLIPPTIKPEDGLSGDDEEEEEVQINMGKPVAKGRQMYFSGI